MGRGAVDARLVEADDVPDEALVKVGDRRVRVDDVRVPFFLASDEATPRKKKKTDQGARRRPRRFGSSGGTLVSARCAALFRSEASW